MADPVERKQARYAGNGTQERGPVELHVLPCLAVREQRAKIAGVYCLLFFAVLLSLHSPDLADSFGPNTVLLAGLNKGAASKGILPKASSISHRFILKGGLF